MPAWLNNDVLDNGLSEIVSEADAVHLISAYAEGDSYAAVLANSIASASLGGGDFTLADMPTPAHGRQVVTGPKSATASATVAAGADLHFALIDTAGSRVLAVADETTNQAVTAGNTVEIPGLIFQIRRPSAP